MATMATIKGAHASHFVATYIGEFTARPFLLGLAEIDPLQHPKHVSGGQDGADGADHHVGLELGQA